MKRRGSVFGVAFLAVLLVFLPPAAAFAETAEVLPKGVSTVRLESNFYFPVDTRFNENGAEENPAANLNGNLNSTVFTDLRMLEQPNLPPQFGGLPPGTATLGTSVVKFEYDFTILFLSGAYGVTDRLAIMARVPYIKARNNVSARLDTTNATVGKNTAINSLAPLAVPGTVPLTTEDIQNLIGIGLDINSDGTPEIPGYGYKRVETWEGQGIGDIELGGKYKYYGSERWRLAAGAGIRLPTGKKDDPDSLVDYAMGYGVYALLFRAYNDLLVTKDLTLNATLSYDWQLPDEETLRVPENSNQGLTKNKGDVDRNPGDIFGIELQGTYFLTKAWSASANYKYAKKGKDSASGSNPNFRYQSLEDETAIMEQVYTVGIAYSTIQLYTEKKFPVPLTANIAYRNRFDGKNNVYKSDYVQVGLQVFF